MLNRPTAFDDIFKENNKIITQSEIKIFDTNGNDLLTMSQIEKVETHLKNSFLYSYYPTEETNIDILGWNTLSQTIQQYLTTKGNFVYIKYGVEGIWTTGCRVGIIDEYQISYRQNRATIRCIGIINSKILTAKNIVPLYLFSTSHTWTASAVLSASSLPSDNKTMNYSVDNNFSTMANLQQIGLTKAEAIQNLCTACGGAVRVNYDNDTQTFTAGIYDVNHIEKCDMSFTNIYDDISIKNFENYAQVSISGYTLGDTEQVYTSGFYTSTGQFTQTGTIPSGYVITNTNNIYVVISNTTFPATSYMRNDNSISGSFNTGSYTGGGNYYIVAQKYIAPTYTQSNTALSIVSYLLPNDDATQKAIIEANALQYLSYEKEISFSGRINPVLEPLDYLGLDEIGLIILEEVSIVFNGAYSGRIKGIEYWAKAPVETSSHIPYPDEFEIYIQNPNPIDMELILAFSSGSFSFNVPAGQTFRITQDNAEELYDSIDEWLLGHLDNPVYCYFKYNGKVISDNTIILEGGQ